MYVLASHVELVLREESCMNGGKKSYTVSVKLSYLFQFLAHTPYN